MNLDLTKEERSLGDSKRHYIAIVLDRSGSMKDDGKWEAAIDSFNQQIAAIKAEADVNTKVSLVTFGSDVTPIFFNRAPSRLEPLNKFNYVPEGWTCLYDAVGYTVNRLSNEAEYGQNATFLVVIISDGYENRSTDYNSYSLASLIQQKQYSKRWTFTYAGSNQDLGAIARTLNIPINNTFTFTDNAKGLMQMGSVTANSIGSYMRSVNDGDFTSSSSFYTDTGKTSDQ